MKNQDWQLATALWDGSIQLWKFVPEAYSFEPIKVLAASYYDIPRDQSQESMEYRDLLRTDIMPVPSYWEHVDIYCTNNVDSKFVVSCNIENVIRIWDTNQILLGQNQLSNPIFTIEGPSEGGRYLRAFKILLEPENSTGKYLLRVYFLSPNSFCIWTIDPGKSQKFSKCIYQNNSLHVNDMALVSSAGFQSGIRI